MGISIGDYVKERKDLTIQTNVGELHVTYNPHAVTPSDEAKLVAAREESAGAFYQMLLTLVQYYISDWDLFGPLRSAENPDLELVAEGEKVPIKAEIFQHLPTSLMTAIYTTITADNVPKSSNPQKRPTQKTSPENSGGVFPGSFD